MRSCAARVDTYTAQELVRCSAWCLTEFTGTKQVFVGIRDRAMLLLSSTTAFRGESCRILEWSDLFLSSIPMDDIQPGYKVPVCMQAHTIETAH